MSHFFIDIGEMLPRNGRMFPEEIALVERNPAGNTRSGITWQEFDRQATRFSNFLIWKSLADCTLPPGRPDAPNRSCFGEVPRNPTGKILKTILRGRYL